MSQNSKPTLPIGGIIFAAALVAVLVTVYLLSGRRTSSLEAEAATPTPTVEITVTAAPVVTPYGRTAEQLITALSAAGYTCEQDGDGYLLTPPHAEEAGVDPCEKAHLTLAESNSAVTGFVLAFPVISYDEDGSLIASALEERSSTLPTLQASAMEETFYAVFSAYDPLGEVPATMRSEWCASFLALQTAKTKKSSEDKSGSYRFSVYPYGSGSAEKLCCSVQRSS